MTIIVYLWKFKPNEKKNFPTDVIYNNKRYINNLTIVTPDVLEKYLNTIDFDGLYDLYKLIPSWVTKTDLGRLLFIYFNGGIYMDSDCFILKKFDYYDNSNMILFSEKFTTLDKLGDRECKNPENTLRIANYCFGSKTLKHPFLKEVINECINRLKQILVIEKKSKLNNSEILWVCGPDVITTVYHRTRNIYKDVILFDKTYLNHKCASSWK
jgi:mannosyltransferase OCH1-like enzyme